MNAQTKIAAAAAALAIVLSPSASANDFTVDGLTYTTLSESTVSVKKYVEGTDIVIPATVTDDGTTYTVVNVERQAFYNAAITSLKLPATMTKVGPYAFWKAKMATVEIPEGVESIGYSAFKDCTNLTEVTLPESLTDLGAFWDVTGVDGEAFARCSKLKTINVPGSVTVLRQMNFAECDALTDVTLGEGIDSIGERVFEACWALRDVTIPESVRAIGRAAFNKCGLTSPTVPGSVAEIPNSCFLWCELMTSVTISEGVAEIGKQAFADCPRLEAVETPASVEWIHSDAFQGSHSVKEIRLGRGTSRLGHSALAVWAPDEANKPYWSLTDIWVEAPVPPVYEANDEHIHELSADFFFGDDKAFTDEEKTRFFSTVTLHVGDGLVDVYRNAPIWGSFVNIEGDATTAIELPEADLTDGAAEIWTINGQRVGNACSLPAGVYIIRTATGARKAVVR